jgi:hypothetical protein
MPHLWARNILEQCLERNIPYYFKQSSHYQTENGTALHMGDGTFWEFNQFPDDLALPTPAPPHTYTCE